MIALLALLATAQAGIECPAGGIFSSDTCEEIDSVGIVATPYIFAQVPDPVKTSAHAPMEDDLEALFGLQLPEIAQDVYIVFANGSELPEDLLASEVLGADIVWLDSTVWKRQRIVRNAEGDLEALSITTHSSDPGWPSPGTPVLSIYQIDPSFSE